MKPYNSTHILNTDFFAGIRYLVSIFYYMATVLVAEVINRRRLTNVVQHIAKTGQLYSLAVFAVEYCESHTTHREGFTFMSYCFYYLDDISTFKVIGLKTLGFRSFYFSFNYQKRLDSRAIKIKKTLRKR